MGKLLKNSWALFTGYFILMIAHGFQGNLLGVRSVIEEFNFMAVGAMMPGYFVGYFAGANTIPKLVGKVGHIRVFAAFASMASLSILIHAVFVNPVVWTFARFRVNNGIAIPAYRPTYTKNIILSIPILVAKYMFCNEVPEAKIAKEQNSAEKKVQKIIITLRSLLSE